LAIVESSPDPVTQPKQASASETAKDEIIKKLKRENRELLTEKIQLESDFWTKSVNDATAEEFKKQVLQLENEVSEV
jgi:small-conductance mechanosensitive channel